ncbi:hypothetical protein BG006_005086 [Podila minutissima]|uniref:Uncharacterized protein n=1 Tax=Podila minutissima TaxID=64525 RepID=A0A9P5VLY9_9FUNG|nr:hypothetical protein BG006_005086 [Podila minutissima]
MEDGVGLRYSQGPGNNTHRPQTYNQFGFSTMGRRSLAPGPFRSGGIASNASYTLSALQRCVATLQQSDKTQHDLVSEYDIATARAAVAKDAAPQLHTLLERAQDIVLEMEAQEQVLLARLQRAKEEQERLLAQQTTSTARNKKGGHTSDAKRLESLVKRKDELSLTALEIEEVMDQKREEFRVLLVKAQQQPAHTGASMAGKGAANVGGSFGSGKRTKRNPTNESRELSQMQDERRKEIARRTQALEAIDRDIQAQRKQIADLQTKKGQGSRPPKQEYNPTVPWEKYGKHFNFLESVLHSEIKANTRDKDAVEEAFERLMLNYTREIETRMAVSDKEGARLKRDKLRKVSQMRNLCKQLFPSDNIGQTMVRVLELLTENPQNEVYHRDLVQNEFPPEEERRHNLGRVITILKQISVIELVLESRVEETGEHAEAQEEGQLILRIKFDD